MTLAWTDPDPLLVARCTCGHTLAHHTRDGGLRECQHPSCTTEALCAQWREDRQVEALS